MTREVPLTRGLVALVDDEDFALVSQISWQAIVFSHTTYARGWNPARGARGGNDYMHRMIMGAKAGQPVDHVNRDGLDNQRVNLRFCSASQNAANSVRAIGKHGFRGVVQLPNRPSFKARLSVDGCVIQGGSHPTEIRAGRAYDKLAIKHYGEFATLNFSADRDWLFPHEHIGAWPAAQTPDALSQSRAAA